MKKLLLAFILGGGFLFITGCGEDTIKKDDLAAYQAIEKELDKVAVEYFDNNPHLLPNEDNEEMTVAVKHLYQGKYITEKFVDPKTKKECDEENTSVTITKTGDKKYDYSSHLVCGEYESK